MNFLVVLTILSIVQNARPQGTQQDYCKLNPQHTLCLNPGFGPTCGTGYVEVKPDSTQRATILTVHNDIRQKTADGKETRALNPLPKASNMRKLIWDDELAAIAQGLANTCVFKHDCNKCRDVLNGRFESAGQNLMMSWTSESVTTIDFAAAVNEWYSEVKDFSSEIVPRYQDSSRGVIGHYSQIIWADTYAVGCGGIIFNDRDGKSTFVACNYAPAGNVLGSPVYNTGTPCSACPSGTSCSGGSLCG